LGRIPEITPEEAGRNLARIAREKSLTLFAHYNTDLAGHQRSMAPAVAALQRLDAFLGGVLPDLPSDMLLVMASDHGNLEDVTAGHTLNPTMTLLMGPGAGDMAGELSDLTDLCPALLSHLSGSG
jgi:bisphosphoglycerate-independent phosphoglycerate mutase (AlkP superfamily)